MLFSLVPFVWIGVTLCFAEAEVRQPRFALPFLPGMDIDLSGLSTSAFIRMMSGWGLFNLGTEVQKVKFILSNSANGYKEQELKPEDPKSFLNSTWDKGQKTIIVIHGYTEDGTGGPLSTTKKIITAYVKAKRLENLIFVDFHELGRQINYFRSAKNIKKVGLRVAELLVYLKGARLIGSLGDVRIVGFSLGAHVSGAAAHFAGLILEEKVYRVTGLDPAGPGFLGEEPEHKLTAEDATFVDVIHTNMGYFINSFGIPHKSGHADFYPNGGENQPGCSLSIIKIGIGVCSHVKATAYFANTILGKVYKACPCEDYKSFESGSCNCTDGPIMGEFLDQKWRGNFYLDIPLEA